MDLKREMEKTIAALTLIYFFSLAFDLTVSVSNFVIDKEYFMKYEINQIFKNALNYDLIALTAITAILSIPFCLSFMFFYLSKKLEGIPLIVMYAITFMSLLITSVGHLLGGLTWLI